MKKFSTDLTEKIKEYYSDSKKRVRVWWIFDVLKKDKYQFEAWTVKKPKKAKKVTQKEAEDLFPDLQSIGEPRVLTASYSFNWHRFNLTLEECEDLYKYHIEQGHGAKFYLDPEKELAEILSSEIKKELDRQGVKPATFRSRLAWKFHIFVEDVKFFFGK